MLFDMLPAAFADWRRRLVGRADRTMTRHRALRRTPGHRIPAIFTFLWDPSVGVTNWRAEQAIRPPVVTGKVCGGNRSRLGTPEMAGFAVSTNGRI